MFRNIAEILTMIFIFVFVFSLFILGCLIIVKTMNGSIEMFIDSPIAFLFYGFIFFVFGYGLYYIGYIFNKNKNSKIE